MSPSPRPSAPPAWSASPWSPTRCRTTSLPPLPDALPLQVRHQRAWGDLQVSFKRRGPLTVLDTLRQDGCLKARFPRPEPGTPPEAVTLNCAGGIAGGDRLGLAITAGPGTTATVATQAAERCYRALPGLVSGVATTLHVQGGASLEWLPQETILFDRCALRRRLDVHLAADARFVGLECLVFGRAAMGETVERCSLQDTIALHRDGRLLLHDAVRIQGPAAATLGRTATAAGARAAATLVYAAPDAEALLEPLRAALAGTEAGASCWNGLLLARLLAPGAAELRRAVAAGLHVLRPGRTLPRVWLC